MPTLSSELQMPVSSIATEIKRLNDLTSVRSLRRSPLRQAVCSLRGIRLLQLRLLNGANSSKSAYVKKGTSAVISITIDTALSLASSSSEREGIRERRGATYFTICEEANPEAVVLPPY
ncbi:hypothetical protein AAFF_G00002420 [Aldrovandia affinis]|uniref:Uncharacterized protein n=1 Tax=Aldrovandia affinis TaxID=143900 RepID=A0AAD7TEN7_9TELE|nr:hypothetical protein AAFF_G00002420 [Aldrovandia affinis]